MLHGVLSTLRCIRPAAHDALHSFPTRRSPDLTTSSVAHSPATSELGRSATDSDATRLTTFTVASARFPPIAALTFASPLDRKSTRLNSSHLVISYAVFCLKNKQK